MPGKRPLRLVDYFLVVGLAPLAVEEALSRPPPVPPKEAAGVDGEAQGPEQASSNQNSDEATLFTSEYVPQVLARYPSRDMDDFPLELQALPMVGAFVRTRGGGLTMLFAVVLSKRAAHSPRHRAAGVPLVCHDQGRRRTFPLFTLCCVTHQIRHSRRPTASATPSPKSTSSRGRLCTCPSACASSRTGPSATRSSRIYSSCTCIQSRPRPSTTCPWSGAFIKETKKKNTVYSPSCWQSNIQSVPRCPLPQRRR